jgi:hypothetical protein
MDEMHDEDTGLDDIDDDAERAEEARRLKEVSCLHVLLFRVGSLVI